MPTLHPHAKPYPIEAVQAKPITPAADADAKKALSKAKLKPVTEDAPARNLRSRKAR